MRDKKWTIKWSSEIEKSHILENKHGLLRKIHCKMSKQSLSKFNQQSVVPFSIFLCFYPSVWERHQTLCILGLSINGLQVNGGGVDREFTKTLIIRDFDDVLENPFRYVDLFLLHDYQKKIRKSPCKTCNRGSKVAVLLHWTRVWPLQIPFLVQPVLLIRNTWNLIRIYILQTGILQTGL